MNLCLMVLEQSFHRCAIPLISVPFDIVELINSSSLAGHSRGKRSGKKVKIYQNIRETMGKGEQTFYEAFLRWIGCDTSIQL